MIFLIGIFVFQNLKPLQYIDPFDRIPSYYGEYVATQIKMPFTYKVISSFDQPRDELIVVVINDSLYPRIQNSIDRYIQDLTNEGYATQVITALGGTPEDIRNLLIAQVPNGLVGALLVGDIPIAWWEESSYGEDYPIDFFFTDLDGNWVDTNGNGIYDQHNGSVSPDIWVGRLYASRLTYDNEVRLINNYFDTNHQYRTHALTLPNKGLVYNEVTWYPNDHGMGYLYNDVTVVNNANTTTAYDYKSRLGQEFQFVHLIAHSSCWAHTFFLTGGAHGGGSVFSFEIPFVDPNAFFYFLNCCMAARYTETNNLANWYLFSRSYSQVVIASSSLMYGVSSLANFYQALSNDSTFGDAFKKWHQSNYDWFMGTLFLGDPSLKVLDHPLSLVTKGETHYSGHVLVDWTTYQVENSLFVNGHPTLGNGQNKVWIFWDSGRIVRSDTYGSFFTGSGFAPPESVAWHEYYDFFPTTAADNAGRLWVAWQSFRDYSQYYDHFNIYSSYHHNNSWSTPQYVRPLDGWHDVQPALAAGDDDKVWIAFKSFRDGNANIYVSNATSGGSWINSYALTQTLEDETNPAIVVDQNNDVWVFWSSSAQGHYKIFGRKYSGTWQDVFPVDTSSADNVSVKAAVDSLNRVWLVWHRWIDNQAEIYYSYYDGNDWLTPGPVTSNSADDILPSITVDEVGQPWICWMSDRDGNWNVYCSYYSNGWTIPGAVTTHPESDIDPVIISDDSSRVWIAWATNRNDYWNIYAACTDITAIKEQPIISHQIFNIEISPNPFHNAIHFESHIPFEVRIYTVAGRLLKEFKGNKKSYSWQPGELAQGIYFAQITTDIYEKYVKIIYIK